MPGRTALSVALLVCVFRNGTLAIQSPILGAIGAVLCAAGIALAVWARVDLGRNWGMPMTQRRARALQHRAVPIRLASDLLGLPLGVRGRPSRPI